MHAIYALGKKDLTLLLRKKGAMFFTLVWPLLVSIMFGYIFGNAGPRPPRPGTAPAVAAAAAVVMPRSGFDITFVQGMIWGVIGCVMSFAVGLVSERTHGTFVRLRMAPITSGQLLAGKALACFTTLFVMQTLLLLIGAIFFGLRVRSPFLLIAAMISTATAFSGVMMLVASLGRSEEAASGAGWALLMPMAMFGGAMIPLFVMPPWMLAMSDASVIKWATLALEGAIWRGFGPLDMLLPCAILLGVGAAGLAGGSRALQRFG
jgi:ABC-2 type transport system permease protein